MDLLRNLLRLPPFPLVIQDVWMMNDSFLRDFPPPNENKKWKFGIRNLEAKPETLSSQKEERPSSSSLAPIRGQKIVVDIRLYPVAVIARHTRS